MSHSTSQAGVGTGGSVFTVARESKDKCCKKCEQQKPLSEFPARKYDSGNIGYRGKCRKCWQEDRWRRPKKQKRHCRQCNEAKALGEFNKYKHRSGKTYRRHECKLCENDRRSITKYWKRYDEKHRPINDLLRNWK